MIVITYLEFRYNIVYYIARSFSKNNKTQNIVNSRLLLCQQNKIRKSLLIPLNINSFGILLQQPHCSANFDIIYPIKLYIKLFISRYYNYLLLQCTQHRSALHTYINMLLNMNIIF